MMNNMAGNMSGGMVGNMTGGMVGGMTGPQATGQSHSSEVDPVTKFKMLIPPLKESLQKIMSNAALVFNQNSQIDSCVKNSETALQRFDKNLEEFYSICDQIETALNLAIEVVGENIEAQKHTPLPLQANIPANCAQPSQTAESYPQYINLVKVQLACAKEVHDALVECARKVTDRSLQPPSS